ncbi:hypothetical protein [Streptomyces sp. CB03911]|uniref:hypothetical protein n=1 Tax=Streptomyces sp. CB03911 TaxID=1804758 RepID=UPI00093C0918|nr:hypothetical protein [Streptomyces sp. CB03911]OKI16584.1 hypothetical protein A6A07_11290 [Streptomyces sp. CB03911]
MLLQGLDDWWPCPRCRNNDRSNVSWDKFDTQWAFPEPPEGQQLTFRKHYKVSGEFSCKACGESGRDVLIKGASR